jgi:hypothetical protein
VQRGRSRALRGQHDGTTNTQGEKSPDRSTLLGIGDRVRRTFGCNRPGFQYSSRSARDRARRTHSGATGSVSSAPSGRNGWVRTTFAGGTDPTQTVSSGARDTSLDSLGRTGNRTDAFHWTSTARPGASQHAVQRTRPIVSRRPHRPGKRPPIRAVATGTTWPSGNTRARPRASFCTLHRPQSSNSPLRAGRGAGPPQRVSWCNGPGLRTVPRCRGSGSACLHGHDEPEPEHRIRREGPAHRVPAASPAR